MNVKATCFIAALFVLALAGCDQAAPPTNEATPAPSETAEADAPETLVAADNAWPDSFVDVDDSPLTNDEILGMWSTAPHCTQPTIFMSDGTFTDYTGGTGQWTLRGDRLTMTRGERTYTNVVDQLDANTFSTRSSQEASVTQLFAMHRRCV